MRLPDPIANTTTEAYLAYKAGVLEEGDLKPKLYEPYIHLDAWLAYWAGLTIGYPINNLGKNLFNITSSIIGGINGNSGDVAPNSKIVEVTKTDTSVVVYSPTYNYKGIVTDKIAVSEGEKLTLSWGRGEETTPQYVAIFFYSDDDTFLSRGEQIGGYSTVETTATAPSGAAYARCAMEVRNAGDTVTFYNIMLEKSASATSFEPYTGEPEMLTDEEAFIAYLSGVTNTYPQEFRDPADIRVAAYLRYLISARFGRPEYPVTNEELYLSMLKTKYIPSGDPSSDIVIDGTAKAPFVDVKMYGDTYQQSYTGKNLIGFGAYSNEISGITCTTSPDGTITLNGTRTGSTSGAIIFEANSPKFKLSGTFTMTIIILSGSFSGANIGYNATNSGGFQQFYQGYAPNGTYNQGTITPAQEKLDETTGVNVLVGSGASTFDNLKFKIQVTAGKNHDSDYEIFVGGQASPSPDYPQPIQTVTGEQTVTVTGKNLFDKTSQISNGCTYSSTGSKDVLGNSSVQESYIPVLPSTTYTLHTDATSSQATNFRVFICEYDSNKGFIRRDVPAQTTSNTNTITTTANTYFVRLCFSTVGIDTLQFEKSASPTTYAPYSKQTYPINLGKNLFDKNTDVLNGNYYLPGNIASTRIVTANSSTMARTLLIRLQEGQTYAIQKKVSARFRFGFTTTNNPAPDTDGVITSRLAGADTSASVTFTVPKGSPYFVCNFFSDDQAADAQNGYDTIVDSIQIEAGSQATAYAPYFTPIELCKLGTYQDYIYKDGEDWKVHKECDNATSNIQVNGIDQNISAPSTVSRVGAFCSLPADNPSIDYGNTLGRALASENIGNYKLDTSITGNVAAESMQDGTFCQRQGINDRIYFKNSAYAGKTGEQLKALIAATAIGGVNYWYPLATPTDTTITDTALIAQLEALVSGGAENGTTYIKVNATDPNLPGLLYVEAPKYE